SRGRSSRLHYPPSSFLSPYTTLFRSPTRGVPYKIYARTLAHGGESFARFMALSVPARMGRFLAVTGGVAALGKLADRRGLSKKTKTGLFLGGWTAFYTWYFTIGPGQTQHADSPRGLTTDENIR